MNTVALEKFAVSAGGSVDPSKYPAEEFDLYSIPAYDKYEPEVAQGSEIGSTKKTVQPGDVLLSRIVPHIRRVWVVGPSHGRRQIGSGEWIIFRGDSFDSNYLRHMLMADPFHKQFMQTVAGVGGSLLRARPSEVEKIKIPLPPLPEQKRIAAILDKADAIRRKRQQAVKLTEELLRSVFLDMFGDPVTNPKGWPKTKLSEVVNGKYGIKAGPFGSSLKKEDYTASGYRIYGQEQVIAGRFDVGDYYIGERKFQQLKGCEVAEGDLLVSLVGSFGKVLVVPSSVEPGIINPRLLKITPNCNFVTSIFLAAIIEDTSIQAEFERMAHGGTMGILNVGLLKQLDVILPPLERQYEFASRLKAIKNMKDNLQISCTTSDTLFTSLLQRTFKGEL